MPVEKNIASYAEMKRMQRQQQAHDIGVTQVFIRDVVSAFYAKVRQHPVLRPIFEEKVGDRWQNHLEKMERFWCSVALNTGTYSGKPVQAHTVLTEIKPQHFGIWMGLFEQTLDQLAPNAEAKHHMMSRAQRMSANLENAIKRREGIDDAA